MFNLDQSLTEWRRQMLAAGIKTPAPLEELELHLRDEIDRQIKSGLGEAEAFQLAAQKIGSGNMLQTEFKKVAKSRKILRALLLVTGWVAAGYILADSLALLNFNWNFFNWSPSCNLEAVLETSGIFLTVLAFWFLAKATRDKTSRCVSLLVCLFLVRFAFVVFPPEHVDGSFIRSAPSPFWYRGGAVVLLCAPGIFWIWSLRRISILPGGSRMNIGRDTRVEAEHPKSRRQFDPLKNDFRNPLQSMPEKLGVDYRLFKWMGKEQHV